MRVLLSNMCRPYPVMPPHRDGIDQYGQRFTKGQGAYQTAIEYPHSTALHLIAQNLQADTTVLDAPTLEGFRRELRAAPEWLGLSFPVALADRALEMVRLARAVSPRTRVVLGGPGVACLAQHVAPGDELRAAADEVCVGDGVGFMRRLLGEDAGRPVQQDLPPAGIMRPFGLPLRPAASAFPVVAALGCGAACDFCYTSVAFGHQRLVLADPAELAAAIDRGAARAGRGTVVVVMDEDLFADGAYARELLRRLAGAHALHRVGGGLMVFGSVRSLAPLDPEELVRAGIVQVWLGVESTLDESPYAKRTGAGLAETFARLHDHGVATVGSLILGFDFHDPENLRADIERFVDLHPSMYQVLPLIPPPGTRLYDRLHGAGRLAPHRAPDVHYYGTFCRYQNFSVEELWAFEDLAERLLWERYGPSLVSLLDVYLRGHARLQGRRDEQLRVRADALAAYARDLWPVAWAAASAGPTAEARARAADALARYRAQLGAPTVAQRATGVAVLGVTRGIDVARRVGAGRLTQPRSYRTVYRAGRLAAGPG
jgi:haloalkane dehalogenase